VRPNGHGQLLLLYKIDQLFNLQMIQFESRLIK
jgi:hypothetical protein